MTNATELRKTLEVNISVDELPVNRIFVGEINDRMRDEISEVTE